MAVLAPNRGEGTWAPRRVSPETPAPSAAIAILGMVAQNAVKQNDLIADFIVVSPK
ncbi:MAG: hypothetical protein ACREYF_04815 [Gammaproteobacteria bacterium]